MEGYEFNFETPDNTASSEDNVQMKPRTALEFEFNTDEDGTSEAVEEMVSDSVNIEIVSEKDTTVAELPHVEIEAEGSAFDIFEVAKKEQPIVNVGVPEAASVRSTYMPKFTEASENYRVSAGLKKLAKRDAEQETFTVNQMDPTAELDGEDNGDGKVIVVPTAGTATSEPIDSSISIFKFVTEDNKSIHTEKSEEERFGEEISAILSDSVENDVGEEVCQDLPEAVEEAPAEKEIPDPFDRATLAAYDFERDTVSPEVPEVEKEAGRRTRKTEFDAPNQRDAIKDAFLDSLMSVRVRLAATILLLTCITVVNGMVFIGFDPLAYLGLDKVSGAMAIFDLMFGTCLFVITLPEVVRAVRFAFKREFHPELTILASYMALLVYNLVMIFAVTEPIMGYAVFSHVFGVQVLASVLGSSYRKSADYAGFQIVSKNVVKTVIDKKPTRLLPRENLAVDGVVDEYDSETARTFRTAFVTDFCKNTERASENSKGVLLTLAVSLGVAVVSGAVAFFIFGVEEALTTFASVVMLGCPAFSMLVHKIPYRHAEREAGVENSTFVGEASIYSHADVNVIAYDDTEIFGEEDVSLKKVHLYGKAYNLTKAMTQMYAIFSVVGGPLDHVFSSSLDRKSSTATGIIISDDGIYGEVDGHRIQVGTEEYMRSNGVVIPEDDYKTKISATDSTKVMYGAEDGEVYVKFFVRYSFSEEFTMLLPSLKSTHVVPLIYTRDPNITNDLLKMLTMGEDLIRVMKKHIPRTTEEKTYHRISASVVTLGDKSNAINMVLLANKYVRMQSKLATVELISALAGMALAIVLSMTGFITMPAMIYAIWQFVFCVYLYCVSKRTFRLSKKEKDTE